MRNGPLMAAKADHVRVQNQESSSEDMMHAYALKMWGKVIGNANLEAR